MAITTVTSREFNHDAGFAKRAAKKGSVVVTDRGRPAYVFMTYEEYVKITNSGITLADALAMPDDSAGIDLALPPRKKSAGRLVDLT